MAFVRPSKHSPTT